MCKYLHIYIYIYIYLYIYFRERERERERESEPEKFGEREEAKNAQDSKDLDNAQDPAFAQARRCGEGRVAMDAGILHIDSHRHRHRQTH